MAKISTDRLLGISAILISMLTLIIFIYQTNIIREQSRLSVKPRLSFSAHFNTKDSTHTYQVLLTNKGLGPAIIEAINLQHDHKKYNADIRAFFEAVYPDVWKYGHFSQTFKLSRGSTLSAGESKSLLVFVFNETQRLSLLDYLGIQEVDDLPFLIAVEYSSIYEERWKTTSEQDGHPEAL